MTLPKFGPVTGIYTESSVVSALRCPDLSCSVE